MFSSDRVENHSGKCLQVPVSIQSSNTSARCGGKTSTQAYSASPILPLCEFPFRPKNSSSRPCVAADTIEQLSFISFDQTSPAATYMPCLARYHIPGNATTPLITAQALRKSARTKLSAI